MSAALLLKNVSKQYGQEYVVDKINIQVNSGEIFGFCGPNGSGKTTTIRMILNTIYPSEGQISIFGRENTIFLSRQSVGFLSGDMAFEDELSGSEYLQFVADVYKKNCLTQINNLSELLEIDLSIKIRHLSRGNRQKIGLVAALMHDPKLLILDEPTSGFDPLIQNKFVELIQAFRDKGGTVFMSSHILSEVQKLCDRVAFIKEGKVIDIKTVLEFEKLSAKYLRVQARQAEIERIQKEHVKIKHLKLITKTSTTAEFHFYGDAKPILQFFASYKLQDITIRDQDLHQIFSNYYEDSHV